MNSPEAQGSASEPLPSESRAQLGDSERAELRKLAAELRARLHASADAAAQPAGNTILLTGPAGTAKTMAAEVLGRELGANVLHVDLRQVVSNYIGETEKNLSAVFEQAAASNSILFFDEADALFGKRSDVKDSHDRYAITEPSDLFRRAREHRGIVVVACSLCGTDPSGNVLEFKIPH